MLSKKIIQFLIISILTNILISQNLLKPLNGPFGVDLKTFGLDSFNNYYIIVDGNTRIFKSTDKGQNWIKFEEGIIDNSIISDISKFILSPDSSLYLVDYNVLYILRPQSDVWELIETEAKSIHDMSVNPLGEIYIVSSEGIFKSSNQGNDFTRINDNVWINGKISTNGNNKNFILDNYKDIYSFDDDGSNLQQLVNPDPWITYADDPIFYDNNSGKLFFVGDYNFWVSEDMGVTWDALSIGDNEWIALAKIHNDKIYAYSIDGLMFSSAINTFNWQQEFDFSNYFQGGIKSLQFSTDDNILVNSINSSSGGWFRKYDFASLDIDFSTIEEIKIDLKQPPRYSINKNKNGLMYINISYFKHYYSFDDLETLHEISLNQEDKFLIKVIVDDENNFYAIDSDYRLLKSEDLGTSWVDITPNIDSSDKIFTLSMNHKKELYAISKNNYLFKSSDKGFTWEEKGIANKDISDFINGRLYFDHNGDIFWTTSYVSSWYVSHDDGSSWHDCFEKHRIYDMKITSDGTVFVDGKITDSSGIKNSGTFIFKDNNFTKVIGHYFTSIDKNKAEEIFLTYNNIIKSIGENDLAWTYYDNPYTNPEYTSIMLDSDQYLYVLSPHNTIYKSISPTVEKHFVLGYVFYDENENCLYDSSEIKLENWELQLSGDTLLNVTTDIKGKYLFNLADGDYNLSITIPNDASWKSCVNNFHLTLESNQFDSTFVLFPVKTLPNCPKMEIEATATAIRRCENNSYTISYQNIGQDSSTNNKILIEFDSILVFTKASIPPSVKDENIIEFKIKDLDVNENGNLELEFYLPCEAKVGQRYCLISKIVNVDCEDSEIVSDTLCLTSIDQRISLAKTAFIQEDQITEFVEPNKMITYRIEFQNTGFDTINNIKILDTISSFLDIQTLDIVNSSHSNEWKIIDDTLLEVSFENILLPDSTTSNSESIGFVDFDIMQKKDLPINTVIENQGWIEFSSHYPKNKTNLLVLMVKKPDGTEDICDTFNINVFPQPFSTKAKINITDYNLSEPVLFEVYNSLGKKIHSEIVKSAEFDFYRNHLPSGIYYLTIRGRNQLFGSKKLIIQ